MSAADTIKKYRDAFDRADVETFASLYASPTSYRNPFTPAPLTTPEQVQEFEGGMFAAFSDATATLEDLVDDGDHATARVTIRAHHTAELQTPNGSVPATQKVIELHVAEFVRVDGAGHIVEHHRIFDVAGFLAQLGLAG